MTDPNEDIFARIKDALQNHEETYDEGAWERFKETKAIPSPTKTAKTISLWKWVAAAAAVMTAVFFIARVYNATTSNTQLPAEENAVAKQPQDSFNPIPNEQANLSDSITNRTINEPTDHLNNNNPNNAYLANSHNTAISENSVPEVVLNTTQQPNVQKPVDSNTISTYTAPAIVSTQPKTNEVDFWKPKVETNPTVEKNKEQEKQVAVASPTSPIMGNKTEKEKSKKWQPSLYVSPLFGDLGINMGYGVSMGYAINDKIKISSGIAHTRISASRNFETNPPAAATASVTNTLAPSAITSKGTAEAKTAAALNKLSAPQTNSLQQVDGSLSGIDIPVEINYNISKKIYAAAGVSGMVVLNDNKTYTYLDRHNVKVSVETSQGNLKETKSVTFSDQNTTDQPIEAPGEKIPFLGFYNISMGYRQKISGKTGISLEPFLKVPMKNVTQQNLRYTGTGIRLKFDF